MSEVMVNFIAFTDERDACEMVLVEGPWIGALDENLSALQDRIYGCLNAALDGKLAEQFPAALGKPVVIRVDCYDLPQPEVQAFVERFAEGIALMPDYSTAGSEFVREFRFEVGFDESPSLH